MTIRRGGDGDIVTIRRGGDGDIVTIRRGGDGDNDHWNTSGDIEEVQNLIPPEGLRGRTKMEG